GCQHIGIRPGGDAVLRSPAATQQRRKLAGKDLLPELDELERLVQRPCVDVLEDQTVPPCGEHVDEFVRREAFDENGYPCIRIGHLEMRDLVAKAATSD